MSLFLKLSLFFWGMCSVFYIIPSFLGPWFDWLSGSIALLFIVVGYQAGMQDVFNAFCSSPSDRLLPQNQSETQWKWNWSWVSLVIFSFVAFEFLEIACKREPQGPLYNIMLSLVGYLGFLACYYKGCFDALRSRAAHEAKSPVSNPAGPT